MYSTGLAYFLWLISGFGALGFHRFYLGKIPTGILWMCTGGLAGLGCIYDFLTLPRQVRDANFQRALLDQIRTGGDRNWRYADDAKVTMGSSKDEKEHPERQILKLAKESKGILTISEVSLRVDISLDEAKNFLERLVSKGFAELRVLDGGTIVYVIPDLLDKDDPLRHF